MTDCEVVALPADVVGDVGSRHSEVVAAFNRITASRQRRITRLVEARRLALDAVPSAEEGT